MKREKSMLSVACYLAYLNPYLNKDLDFSIVFKPFGIEVSSYVVKDLPTGVLVELLLNVTQSQLLDPEEVVDCLIELVDLDQIKVLENFLALKAS
jgi:hypothetical protein